MADIKNWSPPSSLLDSFASGQGVSQALAATQQSLIDDLIAKGVPADKAASAADQYLKQFSEAVGQGKTPAEAVVSAKAGAGQSLQAQLNAAALAAAAHADIAHAQIAGSDRYTPGLTNGGMIGGGTRIVDLTLAVTNAATNNVTLNMTMGFGSGTATVYDHFEFTDANVPDTLKFGVAASTGGVQNEHSLNSISATLTHT